MANKATVQLKLKTSTMPNFLKVDNGQDRDTYVDVCELSPKEIEAYIRQWAHDFRNHIANRKLRLKM